MTMHDIDCEILIQEIEKRTPLYDTSSKEYNDRQLKRTLWNEVCREVYSSTVWNSLTSGEKVEYVMEVQKRWASLRHCFRREIALQKAAPGSTGKKKRKYLYFDSLLFLWPFAENIHIKGPTESNETESSSENTLEEPRVMKQKAAKSNPVEINLPKEDNQVPSTSTCEPRQDRQDEDELFLRSLTSYMKDFTGDQKLLLRMEIIKLILNFKQSLNDNSKFVKCEPDT